MPTKINLPSSTPRLLCFGELGRGETVMYKGDLWIFFDTGDLARIRDGYVLEALDVEDEGVELFEPVDIEINVRRI